MTQNSKKSLTPDPPAREIWLSGNENINLVTDLIDPVKHSIKGSGRSKKLALTYALAALNLPNQKIRIKDHFNRNESHHRVQVMVARIFDTLGIDYELGTIPNYIRDDGEFTGVKKVGDGFYITAKPNPPPTD